MKERYPAIERIRNRDRLLMMEMVLESHGVRPPVQERIANAVRRIRIHEAHQTVASMWAAVAPDTWRNIAAQIGEIPCYELNKASEGCNQWFDNQFPGRKGEGRFAARLVEG